MRLQASIAAVALALQAGSATARTIVLTNDDGLTSNTVALYRALKQQGHDVIVAVPCNNQSGMGAAIKVATPIGPLQADCRSGAAKAGAPGVGPMTRPGIEGGDFFYVDGTAVMALLYGLDVISQKRWGKQPDLVLSGPNEGQNAGSSLQSSGTVSAAQAAMARGLPAIALSAGFKTSDDVGLANPESTKVAGLSVKLIGYLDKLSNGGPILPAGTSLNVNFPNTLDGVKWRAARIGTYNAYTIRFAENMASASAAMQAITGDAGKPLPELPGLVIGLNPEPPGPDQQDDASVVLKTAIAVSAMQSGVTSPMRERWLMDLMREQPIQ